MNPILGLVKGIAEPLIDRLVPDKNAAREAKEELESKLVDGLIATDLGQMAVNQEEAKHSSIFVAGWRPFIGWVCGIALAYNSIVYPFLLWAAWMFPEYQDKIATAPELDPTIVMPAMMGMLGLGAMRSFEKKHEVAREDLKH